MEPAKVLLQPSAYLWTPKGVLGELEHVTGFEPRLLGTWDLNRSELSALHQVEDSPSRFPEDRLGSCDVDQPQFADPDSSHC